MRKTIKVMKAMGIAIVELTKEVGVAILAMDRTQQICTICKFEGIAKTKRYGSLLAELFMWGTVVITLVLGVFMFSLWIITFFLFVFSLYYSLKRFGSSTKICPQCKNEAMIPIETPRAQEMLKNKNK